MEIFRYKERGAKTMDKKKLAAAMAAVTAFINTNEAAAAGHISESAPLVPQGKSVPKGPALQMNLWGITGRQALMQAGTMMQLRMFK
jgi:hypothetical protein